MAPLHTTQDSLPRKNSTVQLNSSSNPHLKTYSKRALQDSYKPPSKRQCVEASESINRAIEGLVQSITPTLPKKRAISDYFKVVTHSNTPSTPQSFVFSSDPVHKDIASPPSSPPLPHAASSAVLPKTRARRRLTARPPLELLIMTDVNAGGSRRRHKGMHDHSFQRHLYPALFANMFVASSPFMPGSQPRKSYLSKKSPPGLRQAVRDGTSSEEESDGSVGDYEAGPGREDEFRSSPIGFCTSRIPRPEPLTVQFAPARRYTSYSSRRGQRFSGNSEQLTTDPPAGSLMTFPPHNIDTFSSAETSVPDQSAISQMVIGHMDSPATGRSRSTFFAYRSVHPALSATSAKTIGNPAELPSNIGTVSALLGAANPNVGTHVRPNVQGSNLTAPPSGNLVQSQLNLGISTIKTCKTCRFAFNTTIGEDVRAHVHFHDTYISGVLVVAVPCPPRSVIRDFPITGDQIIVVTRSSPQSWKNLAMTVLGTHVDKELGSVAINADRLWSSIPDPEVTRLASEAEQVDKYKVYMYIKVPSRFQAGRVVSLLLAEHITSGFETWHIQLQRDEFGSWPPEVVYTQPERLNKSHEAILGVNKFWTLRKERRKGYGKMLLDAARENFIFGYMIPRVQLAWTQTTEEGAKYAKTYMQNEAEYDYLTYDDL